MRQQVFIFFRQLHFGPVACHKYAQPVVKTHERDIPGHHQSYGFFRMCRGIIRINRTPVVEQAGIEHCGCNGLYGEADVSGSKPRIFSVTFPDHLLKCLIRLCQQIAAQFSQQFDALSAIQTIEFCAKLRITSRAPRLNYLEAL